MQTFWQKFQADVLDAVYPIHCLGCGKNREDLKSCQRWLCPDCLEKVKLRTFSEQVCPVCEESSVGGVTHDSCARHTVLDGVWASAHYDELLKKVIHNFKFRFFAEISEVLAQVMLKSLRAEKQRGKIGELLRGEGKTKTLLIPIPLHPKRENWRGFNQSGLLACALMRNFSLTLRTDLLCRVKHTPPQSGLQAARVRRRNVEGAFECRNVTELQGRDVVLVDDISTTLATLEEAAKTLKKGGARQVWALIVARR